MDTKIPQDQINEKVQETGKHRSDVQKFGGILFDLARDQFRNHDIDKLEAEKNGIQIAKDNHYKDPRSRHHALATNADDINLIDLLEHISDMASASEKYGNEIMVPMHADIVQNEFLKKLLTNSYKLLKPALKAINFIETEEMLSQFAKPSESVPEVEEASLDVETVKDVEEPAADGDLDA